MAANSERLRGLKAFLMTVVIAVLFGVIPSLSAQADDGSLAESLDGRSFNGKIYWVTFPFNLLRFKDTIEFNDGIISSTRSVASGYEPAPYETAEEDGHIIFSARAVRSENDYFVWSGVFDGESLSDVKMVWFKNDKDRTYRFKVKK